MDGWTVDTDRESRREERESTFSEINKRRLNVKNLLIYDKYIFTPSSLYKHHRGSTLFEEVIISFKFH